MTRLLQRAFASPAPGPAAREPERLGMAGVGRLARRLARRAGVAALALVAMHQAACYRYVPLSSAPDPGTVVRLELNDQGRAELADSIGPSANRIEGKVRSAANGAYELDVSSVWYFTGRMQRWSGESLRIPASYVGQLREKRFDRKRTFTVGAGAVAAVVLAIIGADLVGSGDPGRTPIDPPPVGNQ